MPSCDIADCGGCACHLAPPCGHCTDHIQEDIVEVDTEPKPFKDLGWMNNWATDPPEYAECVRLGHQRSDVDVGPPHRGMEHVVKCEICRIVCRYDSSD